MIDYYRQLTSTSRAATTVLESPTFKITPIFSLREAGHAFILISLHAIFELIGFGQTMPIY